MNIQKLLLLLTASASAGCAVAQTPTASDAICAGYVANNVVPFDISDEGKQFTVRWGMDTAWANEQNMRKGIAHIGKANLSIARLSFSPIDLVTDENLSTKQKIALNNRISLINRISSDVEIMLNDDHEVLTENYTKNNVANVNEWAALINATVKACEARGHKVISIAPFNEPDYGWGQGSIQNFYDICKALQDYPACADIPIAAGNTLNCDKASYWYNYMKPYVKYGVTHQLAGSFDSYASFFEEVAADGNIGYADEMHNVGEAMVGVEHGMQMGVWWGFDARARGQYCRSIADGARLAYAEDRSRWTAASVMRNNLDDKIQAFIGTSERQANKSSYMFVSKDRDVYYEGQGPMRAFSMAMPGGTGYQQGQTNAERVIDITYGEDVQPSYIRGRYIIMNKASKKVMSIQGGSGSNGANICQNSDRGSLYQQWDIMPVDSACGGDFSYYTISSVLNGYQTDVVNFSMDASANVMVYDGAKGSNEQWYLEYAGDGYYYIINKESNLCLEVEGTSSSEGANIRQTTKMKKAGKCLWKIIPVGAPCETEAPEAPTGLLATPQSASVLLSWNDNTEEDLDGYMILRRDADSNNWNTIGRKIKGNSFIDNTVRQGKEYTYKIKAIDKSENMSAVSDSVTSATNNAKTMIAQWQFDKELVDYSENSFNASIYDKESYTMIAARTKSGENALSLNGSTNYLLLPYQTGDMKEMTFCAWVYLRNNSTSWQRIFDFGNGTDQYMFLTPSNGSNMRFAIKNGGDEQIINCTRKLQASSWKHVAVTIGADKVRVYVDGEVVGESSEITIRPSDFHPVMNYIGRSQFVSDPMLDAYIDDVRIFNYELTEAQLADVMTDLTNGIETVSAGESVDGMAGNAEAIYSAEGKRLSAPAKGINIIRMSDGTTRKVLVK